MTFVLSDVEGSTALRRVLGDESYDLMIDEIRRAHSVAARRWQGVLVSTEGDSCFLAFSTPDGALAACREVQERRLGAGAAVSVAVRMGVHQGTRVRPRGGDYSSLAVHQTARVAAAAHGGQVLVTGDVRGATSGLCRLGLFRLRDFDEPMPLYALDLGTERALTAPNALLLGASSFPSFSRELMGRGRELERLLLALTAGSVVTVVGPAGAGKTRLAVEAAVRAECDAAWFVEVSTASDASSLASAVRRALADLKAGEDLDQLMSDLAASVGEHAALIVLDNCEHLLDPVAELVDVLRSPCPQLRVLCTSQRPLGLPFEHVIKIGGLALPLDGSRDAVNASAAAQLFLDRAALVTHIRLDSVSAGHLSELLVTLDGLPLAIELVAAMMWDTPLSDLDGLIRGSLTNDDEMPPARGRPPRHATLQAVLQWATDALDETERSLLSALALATPPVASRTAMAAAGGIGLPSERARRAIEQLEVRSLLATDADGNVSMLEAVRLFAGRTLGAGSLRQQTIEALVHDCLAALGDPLHPTQRLTAEQTVVLPTARALLHNPATAPEERQRLALALATSYFAESAHELEREMRIALELPCSEGAVKARLLEFLAGAYMVQGRYDRALEALDAATPLVGTDPTDVVFQLHMRTRANLALRRGNYQEAQALREQFQPHAHHPRIFAQWQNVEALAYSAAGDHAKAVALYEQVVAAGATSTAMLNLADAYARIGETANALRRVLDFLQEEDRLHYQGAACHVVATALTADEPWTVDASVLLLWSLQQLAQQGHSAFQDERAYLDGQLARARMDLDEKQQAYAHEQATSLDPAEAVAFAVGLAERWLVAQQFDGGT